MTLEDLLKSRDARVARQAELLSLYPGKAVICLTVILPGPEKRDWRSQRIAIAAVSALKEEFRAHLLFCEERDLDTGFEGYYVADISPFEAKHRCCTIEDTHPLGRLMDIDVIVPSETTVQPLGREVLGMPPRKCLLCGNEVRRCIRARTHNTEELLAKITEMVDNY